MIGHVITKEKFITNLRKQEIEIFEKADGIICPSYHSLESYFSDDFECRQKFEKLNFIEVISGVNDILDYKIEENNANYILYLGRYHESKGFDLYLEASRYSKFDIEWFCAGSGQLEERIQSYDKIINKGWVSDIKNMMKNAALIVVPNRSTFFDLVILEALSLGKPILTTKTGGNKALISTKDIYMCDPNAENIGSYIDSILNENSTGFSIENRKVFDDFYSIGKLVERYNKLSIILKDCN
ncbi:glycosyltransferase [Photobacterium leiognathi]|uniref:glycosyltransferase n=1 Tax=Photobacterium leiognathi TaxID=553611 RepID=UPI0027356C1B|nr:glycosyltransferase [Photobacterium leiognathi]